MILPDQLSSETAGHRPTRKYWHGTGLIELTVNEFRRLFDAILLTVKHSTDTLLAWSQWRRRHQESASECHYRRRQQQ